MIEVNVKPEQILFFDIETAPSFVGVAEMEAANPNLAKCVRKKKDFDYSKEAGLYPEFSKVVCISAGLFSPETGLRLKSYTGTEPEILSQFMEAIGKLGSKVSFFCGHNIKEFDVPFIIKRCVVNRVKLAAPFRIYGRKPWEMNHLIDTMEIWKCGSFKGGTGLETLAALFGLENPKEHTEEMSVSEMWFSGGIEKIAQYCEADVKTTANVFCAMTGNDLIK